MAPIVDAIKAANAAKDRASPFVNHMNAIAEGLNAFQWVAVVRLRIEMRFVLGDCVYTG